MPDFSRPEYASYVALCHRLNLPREWQEGDWVFQQWVHQDRGYSEITTFNQGSASEYGPPRPGSTWLPSLSDWLEVLEETGVFHDPGHGDVCFTLEHADETWWCSGNPDLPVGGPTPEEACARLWMAVRKPAEVKG